MPLSDLLHLFLPRTCAACGHSLGHQEEVVCIICRADLPIALNADGQEMLKELFVSRFPVQEAAVLFYYEKIGVVQQLIHRLKYRGDEEISGFLGRWAGTAFEKSGRFDHIDFVMPVPADPKRYKMRGYNQVSGFGREIAKFLGVRFRESVLIKTKTTTNQAKLNQGKRLEESGSPYQVQEAIPDGSNIMLVDDVVTTGATLSVCARTILENTENVRLNIVTMAISI